MKTDTSGVRAALRAIDEPSVPVSFLSDLERRAYEDFTRDMEHAADDERVLFCDYLDAWLADLYFTELCDNAPRPDVDSWDGVPY